jgi:hypothetical protein
VWSTKNSKSVDLFLSTFAKPNDFPNSHQKIIMDVLIWTLCIWNNKKSLELLFESTKCSSTNASNEKANQKLPLSFASGDKPTCQNWVSITVWALEYHISLPKSSDLTSLVFESYIHDHNICWNPTSSPSFWNFKVSLFDDPKKKRI